MTAASQPTPRQKGVSPIPNARMWQPGQSGNPGGHPKGMAEVRAAARSHTALAMETLATCCRDAKAPWPARVAAAEALLNRGWGKPLQPVDVGDARPLADVPAEVLLRIVGELRQRLGEPEVIEGEADGTDRE
jgi:hypothetical protein